MSAESYYCYPLVASEKLTGAKNAVLSDGIIYVSPAMMTLIQGAQQDGGDALERLLSAIPLLDLDEQQPKQYRLWGAA